jgi:hypothetical protein
MPRAASMAIGEKSSPAHPSAEAGPRQRVEPEVALEVHQVEPVNRSYLLHLERAQRDASGLEPLDVVEV